MAFACPSPLHLAKTCSSIRVLSVVPLFRCSGVRRRGGFWNPRRPSFDLLPLTNLKPFLAGTCLAARCPTLPRDRGTSHPCERGAGLLEDQSNPPGDWRRNISQVPLCLCLQNGAQKTCEFQDARAPPERTKSLF